MNLKVGSHVHNQFKWFVYPVVALVWSGVCVEHPVNAGLVVSAQVYESLQIFASGKPSYNFEQSKSLSPGPNGFIAVYDSQTRGESFFGASAGAADGMLRVNSSVTAFANPGFVVGTATASARYTDVVRLTAQSPEAERAKASVFTGRMTGNLGIFSETETGHLPHNNLDVQVTTSLLSASGGQTDLFKSHISVTDVIFDFDQNIYIPNDDPFNPYGVKLFMSISSYATASAFSFGSGIAYVDFAHTLEITGIGLVDEEGKLLPADSFRIDSELGWNYAHLGPTAVPEPSSLGLLGTGILFGSICIRIRRGQRMTSALPLQRFE